MTTRRAALTLLGTLLTTPALAGPDCDVPLSSWQTREAVQAQAHAWGWTVRRIKIDDGCYEVEGQDSSGRSVEATVDPLTLEILEQEFENDHEASRHRDDE